MSQKKALLIASPYGDLRGPLNDVEKMTRALDSLGFEIFHCCGISATRDGIINAWNDLNENISDMDSVVIYFSGHGGMVEFPGECQRAHRHEDPITPRRYQFLVPVDFEKGRDGGFQGILDIELSYLLRKTTDKTKNVTIILDCCHAGRMVREPGLGNLAVPKRLSRVHHYDLSGHINHLGDDWKLQRGMLLEDNPFAVRIAAAADSETAWEYLNTEGEWCGVMTEALVSFISNNNINWRSTLLRVTELVTVKFPSQHPQVEGPGDRLHFSLEERNAGAFHIRNEGDGVFIHGGRISGVHEGNIYSVMPFGSTEQTSDKQLAEARVTHLMAFKAKVDLSFDQSHSSGLPDEGAFAFLRDEVLYKWPVEFPSGIVWLENMVQGSKRIRKKELEDNLTLAEFKLESQRIVLRNNRGIEIAESSLPVPADKISRILSRVEQLARAQHLLALKNETSSEILEHKVKVEFGLMEDTLRRGRIIQQDGTDSVTEDDFVYIDLVNNGTEIVYAWVFNVNAVGKIALVSNSWPKGIKLQPNRHEVLGSKGLPVSWPKGMNLKQLLEEHLIIILTSSIVDLVHLANPVHQHHSGRTSLSKLEQLTYSISSGCSRDALIVEDDAPIRYGIIHIPFLLCPKIASGPISG